MLLLQAPCCGKTYICRLCHNDAELHEIDRRSVVDIVCNMCGTKQPVSSTYSYYAPPAIGGIKRYRDPSVCPSVCPSPRLAAALGYRHAGCLQLSDIQTADLTMDGCRSAVSRSAISGRHIVLLPQGR